MPPHAAPPTPPRGPSDPLRIAALALLGIAILLSAWLIRLSLSSGPIAGCDAGNCGVVLASKWAKVFGAPVGLFGGAAYLILAILGARPFTTSQTTARTLASALVLLIPGAALWFVALQVFVLKAFCPWCCTTHAIASTAAGLMALSWRRDDTRAATSGNTGSTRKGSRPPTPARPVWATASIASAAALAGLVLLQYLSPEPPKPRMLTASMSGPSTLSDSNRTHAATANPVPNQSTNSPSTNAVPAPAPTATTTATTATATNTATRRLTLHDGRFVIDPHVYPCNGSPDADRVMLMISDYTCPHCRAAYKTLKEVREAFDGQRLGITMLPSHHGGDSEELQNLMLSAWKLEPAIWADVASDLYLEKLPLKPDAVRQVLTQRLGPGRLEASLEANRSWVKATVDLAREVHAANRAKTGSGSIPQFIAGQKIVVGAPADAAEFYQILEENLGLVRDQFPDIALETQFDLGRVFAGTGPALSVPYTNTGKAVLSLSRATVPQGGRVLRGLQTPVSPGQTGAVDIAIAVPREPGPFEQTVTLFSNARKTEQKVEVKGVAWKPIRITPSVLDLGRLDPDGDQPPQGIMRLELEEEAKLQAVQSQNPGFAATLREVTPGRAYEILVQPGKSLPAGLQQTTLRVTLQKPAPAGWPEALALAARVMVERAVTLLPQRVLVPNGVLPAERHSQVLVRCNDGTPNFMVTSAVLDGAPGFVQPEVQPGGKTNEFIVRFTLPAGWSLPPAPAECRLTLHTSHPKLSTLDVPIVPTGR